MSIRTMLKAAFRNFVGRCSATAVAKAAYARDPLAHPDIAAMSPREIADLPASELRARGR